MADINEAIGTVQDMLDVMEATGSCYAYKHNGGADRLKNVLDCLRAQQERDRNEPLTLDELREMDGEPVWIVWPDGRIKSQWFIISSTFWIEMFQEWDGTLSKDYGKTWLAYRRKPEEGTV